MKKACPLGKVVVLGTGGTIAGLSDVGKSTEYKPGQIPAEQLLKTVPGLEKLARIETIQLCNVNSDDITDSIWLDLARAINERADDPECLGFVITHGTDTMEETAYFLNLAVKTDKPVVITGAMRPANAISPDGPMNLYQSVVVAAHPESIGRGVLMVFSNQIFSARYASKTSTYSVTAMSGTEAGAIGTILDDMVYFYNAVVKKHTLKTEFDLCGLRSLPRVSIAYFHIDANPYILDYLARYADGIVIAGAGMGVYSDAFIKAVDRLQLPVVVSSRTGSGMVSPNALSNGNSVSAGDLSPQKAAILLRLGLTRTADRQELQRMFLEY